MEGSGRWKVEGSGRGKWLEGGGDCKGEVMEGDLHVLVEDLTAEEREIALGVEGPVK